MRSIANGRRSLVTPRTIRVGRAAAIAPLLLLLQLLLSAAASLVPDDGLQGLLRLACCPNSTYCRADCTSRLQAQLPACLQHLPSCSTTSLGSSSRISSRLQPAYHAGECAPDWSALAGSNISPWHQDVGWQASWYTVQSVRCCATFAHELAALPHNERLDEQLLALCAAAARALSANSGVDAVSLAAQCHQLPVIALPDACSSAAPASRSTPPNGSEAASPLPAPEAAAAGDPVVAGEAAHLPESAPAGYDYERQNVAFSKEGAKVVAAAADAKKPGALLDQDSDTFMKSDCKADKWVIIELAQVAKVDTLGLAQHEPYTSLVREFEVLARQSHPRTDAPLREDGSGPDYGRGLHGAAWQSLGTFTAEKRKGAQTFVVPEPAWARYLAVRFLNQYGSERTCAVNGLEVYGKTATQDLEDRLVADMGHSKGGAPVAGGPGGGAEGGVAGGGGAQAAAAGDKEHVGGGDGGASIGEARGAAAAAAEAGAMAAAQTAAPLEPPVAAEAAASTGGEPAPHSDPPPADVPQPANAQAAQQPEPAGGSAGDGVRDGESGQAANSAAGPALQSADPPAAPAAPDMGLAVAAASESDASSAPGGGAPTAEADGGGAVNGPGTAASSQPEVPTPPVAGSPPTLEPQQPATAATPAPQPPKATFAAPKAASGVANAPPEASFPSGSAAAPSSIYDKLIVQLLELKVQQSKLAVAVEELQTSAAAHRDGLEAKEQGAGEDVVALLQELRGEVSRLAARLQDIEGGAAGGAGDEAARGAGGVRDRSLEARVAALEAGEQGAATTAQAHAAVQRSALTLFAMVAGLYVANTQLVKGRLRVLFLALALGNGCIGVLLQCSGAWRMAA